MADGEEPIKALKNMSGQFNIDKSSLQLLGRDKILQRFFELEAIPLNDTPYNFLYEEVDSGTQFGLMPRVDSEFLINMRHQKNSRTAPPAN